MFATQCLVLEMFTGLPLKDSPRLKNGFTDEGGRSTMNRSLVDDLTVRFAQEQTSLERLQDKTVARLHFIEGALSVLDEIRRDNDRRPTEASGDRKTLEGPPETEEAEAEF
jgi:hypothetical protein